MKFQPESSELEKVLARKCGTLNSSDSVSLSVGLIEERVKVCISRPLFPKKMYIYTRKEERKRKEKM